MTAHNKHQRAFRANAVRVICFVLFTALMATAIVLTLGKSRLNDSREYHAVFTDVSGMTEGSAVRAAGVEVGTVTAMHLREDHQVLVTFEAEREIPLTDATEARVRYANLTGDRYLELTSSVTDKRARLAAGGTIPESRTSPALDLDLLFNGFKPLTRAINPDEVNTLTQSVLAVSQGQGPALNELLGHVASLTNTLGDRATVIGEVIDNLTTVLGTLHEHRDDVIQLIDGLESLVGGLAKDRKSIGSALDSLAKTTETGSEYLRTIRPPLKDVVAEVQRMALVFNSNSAAADRYLSQLPAGIKALGRGGAYGSFFNFFLCGVRFKTDGPDGALFTPFTLSKEFRCQF